MEMYGHCGILLKMSSAEPSTLEAFDNNDKEAISSESSDSEGECETGETRSTTVNSALDRLRPPSVSELSRKRKVQTNTGSKRRGTYKPPSQRRAPKTVTPSSRVRQFPKESLSVKTGKLFCDICRHEVSLVKSVLTKHISSSKHVDGKEEKRKKEGNRKQDLIDTHAFIDKNMAKGSTLSDSTLAFRIDCLKTFMSGGVPLFKLDHFRPLLEQHGERLTASQHMADLIPMIRDKEVGDTKAFLSNRKYRHISIIFDGTTHVCEAMAIIARCVDEDFTIHQRLINIAQAGCRKHGRGASRPSLAPDTCCNLPN